MTRKDLSLQQLELFQICARRGSLQDVAVEAGLSLSTVSHHLRNLEDHLGVALFDHSKRPLMLTPKGEVFLRDISGALQILRKARAEAVSGRPSVSSYLRLGTIEDIDSDIAPEMAVYLFREMPNCTFLYHTDTSAQILDMLGNRQLDIGIASDTQDAHHGLLSQAVLRDPFVVVTPNSFRAAPEDLIGGQADLPLLRFSASLMIGRQIETHLKRLRLKIPNRFECASNQTLMAMVAAGAGWAITTPLLYWRAKRFHADVQVHPFPGKEFARTIGLLSTIDCSDEVRALVDTQLKSLLQARAVAPLCDALPWLQARFCLLET